MTIIDMKKVGSSYQATDMDPYSEYQHQSEEKKETFEPQQSYEVKVVQNPRDQAKDQIFKNIDDMMDGAQMVFDIADHITKRFRGFKC